MPQLSIEDLIANETRAVARIRWRFAPPGQGDAVERETIEIIRVEGGQAVEHWVPRHGHERFHVRRSNKRLKLAARVDCGMNSFSARRSLSAIR